MSVSQNFKLKEIEDFLKINFDDDISNVRQINGGERSKAFLFISSKAKFVLRISSHEDGFKKDEFACKYFSSAIQIPKILKIGVFKDVFYSVSEYCPGVSLRDGDDKLPAILVENILTAADQIHSIPVLQEAKYGVADINGLANYESWEDWVLKDHTVVTKDDGSFFSWNEVKKRSFVDEEIINKLFFQIKELARVVPKQKYLIHGDFATGNIMIENNTITGIIDWNEFGYGDFLFDIAYLDFWINKTNFIQIYKDRFQKNNQKISYYEERIMCHKLFIGLNALGIYAAINWENGYKSVLERIKNIRA